MNRREFLKTGSVAFAAAAIPAAAKAGEDFDWDNPVAVALAAGGRWRANKNEVAIKNGVVTLKCDKASWVRITWKAKFSPTALVMGDAWERTYGDVGWRSIGEPRFSPWYFAVRDGDETLCYGMKTQPGALCSWRYDVNSITLLADVRCGCLDTEFGGRTLKVAELVSSVGGKEWWSVLRDFCKLMCPKPALPKEPVYGGDDWYAYYSAIDHRKIVAHAKFVSKLAGTHSNRPVQMVDAGWQLCHNWYLNDEYIGGPFRYPNSRFPDMKALTDEMKAAGTKPGIWIRPLETVEFVPDGAFTRRAKNVKYLDPTHPFAQEILDGDLKRFEEWGFEVVKWDFPVVDMFRRYGVSMTDSCAEGDWAFHDRTKTSAEISLDYYLRSKAAAPGLMFSACNVFSHLGAGIFENFRIGDDTSGNDFKRCIDYGVNTIACRSCQHGVFYSADADAIGVTGKIPWSRNREYLNLMAASGLAGWVSVMPEFMDDPQICSDIEAAFAKMQVPRPVARPLDFDETLAPTRWLTAEGERSFNFSICDSSK